MADPNPDTDHQAAVIVASDLAEEEATESVASPAKVLRIGSMTKELLEEVRRAPLDDAGRGRLREIYETSVRELAQGLSGDLRAELARLSSPFSAETPSDSELRVAQAQLVGWLEGLFHGIQAAIFAQQMAAQAQLQQMRGGPPGLPPGMADPAGDTAAARPGTYL
ncbi:MAG TPA: proteasome activator [Acidimicrobiales bacterium]|nr:proteasome activator [Acidimicrobiales bacterium]